MQIVDNIGKRGAVVLEDGLKPAVQLVLVVLGAHVDHGALSDWHSEPWLAQNVRHCPHQLEQRLADRAVTRGEVRLIHRDAVVDRPLPFRRGSGVPTGHVDVRQRRHRLNIPKLNDSEGACRSLRRAAGISARRLLP
jgi:hypothetical protein